ncbi:uncharacterized protein (DUF924 family) [Raoultella ornithinolytica]|uniref:Uncharacterized protein (DUF924 family) n=1 Tax=Raoultella ornithinolytica TaxID=54291 RepID=A0ABD7QRK4_RAOOR|nr:uncharacterized protein (DUF924 family) [Raoultella ornithinolytica]
MDTLYKPVLEFWFMDISPRQWFMDSSPELDKQILQRFGPFIKQALQGDLDVWAVTPRGRLALILVLDQFTRNVFRGDPRAYSGDSKAQQLVLDGLRIGMDQVLNLAERHFFYMPLMHAEDTDLQELSVAKFRHLSDDAARMVEFANGHASVVARFGRFPHRNTILERTSCPEEEAFLSSGENRFSR